MRDTQRKKLYDAERMAFGLDAPKLSMDECGEVVKSVFISKRVKEAYDPFWARPPVIDDGRGCRRAASYGGRISLPRWSRMKWVVLHEMAHEVRSFRRKDRWVAEAAHGWQFASTYLDLVMWFMGREAHDKLKAAFKEKRVRYNKPRKARFVSAEERAMLRERLAAARAAKDALRMMDQISAVAFSEGEG